jgi:hypothetical protein
MKKCGASRRKSSAINAMKRSKHWQILPDMYRGLPVTAIGMAG